MPIDKSTFLSLSIVCENRDSKPRTEALNAACNWLTSSDIILPY